QRTLCFVIYGAKTVFPDFQVKDVLTNKALAVFSASVEDGCSAASGAFSAIPANEMLLPNWRENQYFKQFLERNRPGAQPTYGPLLLIGGGDDVIFTEPAGRKVLQRICAAGGQAQRKVYPGLGHDPLVYGSLKDQMEWIEARFAGKPAPNDCSAQGHD